MMETEMIQVEWRVERMMRLCEDERKEELEEKEKEQRRE